jgi:hypothetical protein
MRIKFHQVSIAADGTSSEVTRFYTVLGDDDLEERKYSDVISPAIEALLQEYEQVITLHSLLISISFIFKKNPLFADMKALIAELS